MSTIVFISGLEPILKNDGTINAAGTVEFYQQGTAFATTKAVYSDSGLTTSLGSIITLDSAGHLQCYLSGDYDIKIKDSTGALVRSVLNVNPTTTTVGVDPNLVSNGSFENADLTNWTLFEWNTGTTVVDNVDQTHGAYSVKFVSAGGGGGYVTSALFDCNPATNVFVSFSIKASVANVRNIVQVRWYDKSQAFLSSTTLYDDSATNPTSWTNKTYTTTPPASAVFGAVRLIGCDSSVATAGNTRYDNVLVMEDENNLVHMTGSVNETITGNKTFSGAVTVQGTVTLSGAALNEAAEVSIASAATVNIGAAASNNILITGTTTITAFDTVAAGITRTVRFNGALTLTYNATSLILPGAANITTAANDCAQFESLGSGNWICRSYNKANGHAVFGPAWFPLATKTASNSATISFGTSDFTNTAYPVFMIVINNAIPGTNAQTLQVQISEDNGVTPKTDASYTNNLTLTGSNGTDYSVRGAAATFLSLQDVTNRQSTNEGFNSRFYFYNPSATTHHQFTIDGVSYFQATSNAIVTGQGSFLYSGTTNAWNYLKFFYTTGNIASGTFTLYGLSTTS